MPQSECNTVVPMDRYRRRHDDLPVPPDRLRQAVRELDDFRCSVEEIDCDPLCSADEWRTAVMPILLHLPGARRALSELSQIKAGQWPDTEWAVRVRAAQANVERRLLDVGQPIRSLADGTDTACATSDFSSGGSELANAVRELCGLIARRYPWVVNAS